MAAAQSLRPLVFLGPPGAGKGTQARIVAGKLGVPHISTGDMFRDHAKRGTELGRRVEAVMKRGELVSDDVVVAMVAERIARPDCANGFILDGFPRTVPQGEWLEKQLAQGGRPGALAVNFRISYTSVVRRLTGRRTCVLCGEIYNIYFRPPKAEGRCDRDGGELTQRADDREEVIRKRWDEYERDTQPLVDFYRERGALLDVDAEAVSGELTERVVTSLGSKVSAGSAA